MTMEKCFSLNQIFISSFRFRILNEFFKTPQLVKKDRQNNKNIKIVNLSIYKNSLFNMLFLVYFNQLKFIINLFWLSKKNRGNILILIILLYYINIR